MGQEDHGDNDDEAKAVKSNRVIICKSIFVFEVQFIEDHHKDCTDEDLGDSVDSKSVVGAGIHMHICNIMVNIEDDGEKN